MKNYLKNQKIERKRPFEKAIKMGGALVIAFAGLGLLYTVSKYTTKPNPQKTNLERLIEARTMYQEAVSNGADYQTLQGIEAVIKDIETGKSF